MRAVVRGPGYTLRVVDGFQPPIINGSEIEVGESLLSLDVSSGALSESLASLLLPPIDYDDELRGLVDAYRRRVVAEEASDLLSRLGPLAQEALVHISYFPVARMSRLSHLYPCAFNEAARDIDALAAEYEQYAQSVGTVSDGLVRLRRAKARGVLESIRSRVSAAALVLGLPGAYIGTLAGLSGCRPSALLSDPSRLVRLPEGLAYSNCDALQGLVDVLGPSACKRSSLLYSTVMCREGTKVVIKDYGYGTLKWALAGILSVAAYPFKESPGKRAVNEYLSLRALRRVIGTPTVYGVCVSPLRTVMVREFVEGEVVLGSRDPEVWAAGGEALARVHRGGWALGDSNPGNIVITDRGPYLIDAEQASGLTPVRAAWDLAVYYYYARFFGAPQQLIRESVRAYVKSMGDAWESVRSELFSPGVLYFTATVPPVLLELYSTIKEVESRP